MTIYVSTKIAAHVEEKKQFVASIYISKEQNKQDYFVHNFSEVSEFMVNMWVDYGIFPKKCTDMWNPYLWRSLVL
jgi:hypothetical protein